MSQSFLREWHRESFSVVFHRPSATQPSSQLPSSQLPSSQLPSSQLLSSQLPSSQLHSSQLPPLAKIWQLHALAVLFYCSILVPQYRTVFCFGILGQKKRTETSEAADTFAQGCPRLIHWQETSRNPRNWTRGQQISPAREKEREREQMHHSY